MYIPVTSTHKGEIMPMDSVHNYFERLVINEINEHYSDKFDNYDVLADMACIALNRIPAKYIRYDIDMTFYMSTDDRIKVEKTVKKAVKKAYKKVKASEQERLEELEKLEAERLAQQPVIEVTEVVEEVTE